MTTEREPVYDPEVVAARKLSQALIRETDPILHDLLKQQTAARDLLDRLDAMEGTRL